MYTYQDFVRDRDSVGILQAVTTAINKHINSDVYETAKIADEYDHQKNKTITEHSDLS